MKKGKKAGKKREGKSRKKKQKEKKVAGEGLEPRHV